MNNLTNNKQETLKHLTPIDYRIGNILRPYADSRFNRYGHKGICHSFCDPIYRGINPLKKFYYKIVEFEGDKILLFFHDLNMYPIFYLTLYMAPISLSSNVDKESRILDYLIDKQVIGAILFNETDKPLIESKGLFYEKRDSQNEFYTVVNERWQEVGTNKYKSRYGLNSLISNFKFVGIKDMVGKGDFLALQKLLDDFVEYSEDNNNHIFYKQAYSNMIDYLKVYQQTNNVLAQLLYSNDKLLAAKIMLKNFSRDDVYYAAFTKTIIHTKSFESSEFVHLKNKLNKLMLYLHLKDLVENSNIWIIQNGQTGGNVGLMEHKRQENKNELRYYFAEIKQDKPIEEKKNAFF